MKKVLFFLGELTDQDVDWLVGAATNRSISAGERLVEEGKPIESVCIITGGRFGIVSDGKTINEVGAGEIIGELSFLDSRPPSASVDALEDSMVLDVPSVRLAEKLDADLGFASRFYRALGVLLAYRMREITSQLAYGTEGKLDEADPDEIDGDLLDRISLAGLRFDKIVEKSLK